MQMFAVAPGIPRFGPGYSPLARLGLRDWACALSPAANELTKDPNSVVFWGGGHVMIFPDHFIVLLELGHHEHVYCVHLKWLEVEELQLRHDFEQLAGGVPREGNRKPPQTR